MVDNNRKNGASDRSNGMKSPARFEKSSTRPVLDEGKGKSSSKDVDKKWRGEKDLSQ